MDIMLHELFSKAFCVDCKLVDFSSRYYKVKFTVQQTFEFVQDCAKLLSIFTLGAYPQFAYDNHPYLLIDELLFREKSALNKLNALYHLAEIPLHLAAIKGCLVILKKHLQAGADVNQLNVFLETPLHIAAQRKQLKAFMLLLEFGADVNRKSISNETVMRIAISLEDSIMLEKILAVPRIEINHRDYADNTYLHLAAQVVADETILNKLIEAGISLESCNQRGETPLIFAIYANNLSTTRFLLKKGANINHQDQDGATALHIAASQTNCSILEILIANQAEANIKTYQNETPLQIAMKVVNEKIVDVENSDELRSNKESIKALKLVSFFTKSANHQNIANDSKQKEASIQRLVMS
ncbi:MAG: hypothetical protein RLY40_356 [Pseudomonadota bacterium]|jgi:ankyrin repeat protein